MAVSGQAMACSARPLAQDVVGRGFHGRPGDLGVRGAAPDEAGRQLAVDDVEHDGLLGVGVAVVDLADYAVVREEARDDGGAVHHRVGAALEAARQRGAQRDRLDALDAQGAAVDGRPGRRAGNSRPGRRAGQRHAITPGRCDGPRRRWPQLTG
jgi:hypothetical protein